MNPNEPLQTALCRFSAKVSFIMALELSGRITPTEAYERIRTAHKRLTIKTIPEIKL